MDAAYTSATAFKRVLEHLDIVQQADGALNSKKGDILSRQSDVRRINCAKEVLECRDQILSSLTRLHRLVNHWNTLTLIDSLPVEILSLIFEFLAIIDPSPSLARVTHVCRRWREVALGHAPLWSHLVLDPTYSRYPDFLPTIFHRAGIARLSIDCTQGRDPSYPEPPALHHAYPLIMTQKQRIKTLILPGLHACKYLFIERSVEPWRALETLHIKPLILHGNNLFPQQWPRLKTLILEEINGSLWQQLGLLVPSIRSLHVTGWAGSITTEDWLSALSKLPELERLTIDHRRRPRTSNAVDSDAMPYISTSAVSLPHLRELKVTLWHLEEAALVRHLLYPPETEVTLLWQNSDFLHVDHSALFARAVRTLHRTRGSFTITHCHIALDDHTASLFLGSNTASPSGIHIAFYPRDAHHLCETLCKQGFLADVDRLQYHMLSGQHFMDHAGLLQGATRVRTLELMRLDVMDQIALCASDMPFPELQHLIIVPSPRLGSPALPITSKTKHAVLGLDDFLRGRRSAEHPIRDLTLCPSAQIPHLITKIRKDMPELALHLS